MAYLRCFGSFPGALAAALAAVCIAATAAVAAEAPGIPTTHRLIADAAAEAPLTMLFEGDTEKDCRAWQERFRETLMRLLGDTEPPQAWEVNEEDRQSFEDHTRFSLVLSTDGLPSLPLYLLVPADLDDMRPAPAVLCVHGHGPYGNDPVVGRTDLEGAAENIAAHHYDYGLQFVRRGYVVAAPCMIPFGRRVDREAYRGEDPCAIALVRMQALGRLPMAENLRDLRWALSYLQSRPEVDGDRIGCAGLSYGGRMTMLMTAVDRRIKVAAVSGALNVLQERITHRYSCGAQIIPGLLRYGDFPEIGSLIAPRPCVWEVGSKDGLVVPEWDEAFKTRLKKAYAAYGASGRLRFDHFEGGHRWNGAVAFPLFDEVLKPGQ